MGSNNPHEKLGDRIRKILSESSISQRELARRLHVGPNQVSRWVLGTVAPTYTVLNDILKFCRKPEQAGWLLTGKPSGSITDSKQQANGKELEGELEGMKDLIISLQAKIIKLQETIEERDRQLSELLKEKKERSIKSN